MASPRLKTVIYMQEPANTSAWFGDRPVQRRPKGRFLTNSQKSVIDTDAEGGVDVPYTFRATFKRVSPNSPRNESSPRNVAHRSNSVRHSKPPITSVIIAPSPDPAFQDRPTAVGNKPPFIRPSGQVNNQHGQVSPRLAHGQRANGLATQNLDARQVRKPVILSTRSHQPPPEYRFVSVQHDPYQVVDNRAQTRAIVYQDDPMVRFT